MKPFHAIAIPQPDILAGRVALETFAADLWEVSQGRGAAPYAARTAFFEHTYQSEGLKHVLSNADLRLQGQGGDPVLQLNAPFGAGKTHALIALYHYVTTMAAQQVVIVGTALAGSETLWGRLEQQLTGDITRFSAQTSPGREAIRELLAEYQPVNILIDKISEYIIKAAAIQVGDSTLAAQTLLFFQELSEAISALDRVMLAFTLPSDVLEHDDAQALALFERLQKISGRVERIHNLLQPHEVAPLLRQRLFAEVDAAGVQQAVGEFLAYARQEALLPAGVDPAVYRRRFEASFPFLPEVPDVLYHRWGKYPAFQRVRGMLRLLALALANCRQSGAPYITLADIDLSDADIRYELLHHSAPDIEQILTDDILADTAGAKTVDAELRSEADLPFGTRLATTILFYSFPDDADQGASFSELKRHALRPGVPSNALVNSLQPLKTHLLYLQHQHDRLYFGSRMTLNRLVRKKLESIEDGALEELEEELLHKEFPGGRFHVILNSAGDDDVPDTADLKLVIFKQRNDERMRQLVMQHGDFSRIHRNTLLFLGPDAPERERFLAGLRQFLALGMLLADSEDDLSDDHRKEVRSRWRNMESELTVTLRHCYRQVLIPMPNDFSMRTLALSGAGVHQKLEQVLYTTLTREGDILEHVPPVTIQDMYLRDKPFVFTEQLPRFNATTIGDPYIPDRAGWMTGITRGVQEGLFGLGVLRQRRPVCLFFEQDVPYVELSGNEIVIRRDLCAAQRQEPAADGEEGPHEPAPQPAEVLQQARKPGASERFEARLKARQQAALEAEAMMIGADESPEADRLAPEAAGRPEEAEQPTPPEPVLTSPVVPSSASGKKAHSGGRTEIHLRFEVSQGNVTDLMSVIYSLRHKFRSVRLEIHAEHGRMTAHEYQMNVEELLRNMGVFVEEAEIGPE